MAYQQPSSPHQWDQHNSNASPFHDNHHSSPPTSQPFSTSNSYQPVNKPTPPLPHQDQHHHDDDEQYPVGQPLSYFPTHHQPLSQYDDYDTPANSGQYHQMAPLEHAQSALSSRTPEWGGGGYQGYQSSPQQQHTSAASMPQTDIPLVGINIISSNLEAARNENRYSDTRTAENVVSSSPPVQSFAGHNDAASPGAGVGMGQQYNNNNHLHDNNSQQQQQRESKHMSGDGSRGSPYNQPLPPRPTSNAVDVERGGSVRDVPRGSDGEPIPKVLLDPKVQKQLRKRKVWKPWFIWIVSGIQIAMVLFEIVRGYQRTGKVIETSPFNPMIGPGTGTLITVGARFVPCMRSTYLDNLQIECPDNTTQACTISDICGFTPISSTGKPPNQWFRFITPIFLHGGVVHLIFNLLFQLRTGADLERDMGWWRIGIIYMCSGVAGFVLGGNYAPLLSPSLGASGAIFGLIGCLVLDLVQNWKLVIRPCWELTKLTIMILVSFAFGLLPFLDNFAHIGGFIAGILSGLVFMPVVYFSKRDKFIKRGLAVVALPALVLFIVLGLTTFYKGVNNCSWCKYLSCLPVNGWCDAFNTPQPPNTSSGN